MGDDVWLLWFERERDEAEDIELLIGVYSTEEIAQAAIERVKGEPGFRDIQKASSSIAINSMLTAGDRVHRGLTKNLWR